MRVRDGVATVDRGSGPVEIPLAQATAAPSLSVLAELDDTRVLDSGEVTGLLRADQVALDVPGGSDEAIHVTVGYEPGGHVTRYTMVALGGRWRADVRITDVRDAS